MNQQRHGIDCPSCGAKLSNTDETCRYCGSKNVGYQKSSNSKVQDNFEQVKQFGSDVYNKIIQDKEINWVAFIILLIIFWPAAIIYLVVATKDKEKK